MARKLKRHHRWCSMMIIRDSESNLVENYLALTSCEIKGSQIRLFDPDNVKKSCTDRTGGKKTQNRDKGASIWKLRWRKSITLDVPTEEIYQISHELGQMIHESCEEEFDGRWHRNSSSSCTQNGRRGDLPTLFITLVCPLVTIDRVLLGILH